MQLVGFIIKKFVTMHGYMNVKKDYIFSKASSLAHRLGTVDYFTWIRRTGRESDHFHLVPRLRLCGVTPPLPHMPSRLANG
jgi:hypothetical protein